MRWDDLFADLRLQYEELVDAADDAEQADRLRQEHGSVTLIERLQGAVGGRLRIQLAVGRQVSGQLSRVGGDWLLVRESHSVEVLVAMRAITAVEGLAARTGLPLGIVDSRFDLRKALRAVARDRAPVTLHTDHGGELSGTVDRVGADFLELASHAAWEARRPDAVRGVVLIPLTALVAVRTSPIG